MSSMTRRCSLLVVTVAAAAGLCLSAAAQVNPDLYSGVQWRNVGPIHGGRIAAVTGVIGQPGVFYVGTPQGGIWKTTSAGVTWHPIADAVTDVDSWGAIQVAPSDPNTIYAGSGDSVGGSSGDGMYKSTDAGKTWTHIGLADTAKINRILIDPKDPNVVVASTQGDATHDGGGLYRTNDGGQTWQNVLRPEGLDGTRDLTYDFDNPSVMFATAQGTSSGRGGFGGRGNNGPPPKPAALYKSTDEGKTWNQLTSMPAFPGRVGVAVAMHTNDQRVYVVGNNMDGGSGLFRSDDGGQTWAHMDPTDNRIANGQGAYSCGVYVDSQNPDVVYTMATAMYRSTDGGNTFAPFKGAPGGEDYHPLWIDPTNGARMLVGADQGASVTLDNGKTWSTWYNQPISQVYHVSTNNDYPYWIMAAQQDTGAVMIKDRGDFGEINTFDWLPLPSSEFGTIAADPLHPNIIYGVGYGPGGGGGSNLVKIDITTGQWQNVAPNFGADSSKYRSSRDAWKRFDPFDQSVMYIGYQCLLETRDGAQTWTAFSPDLTTTKEQPQLACGAPPPPPEAGLNNGGFAGGRGGGPAINDFQISTVKRGVFWSVSSNDQIYNTMDGGKHWDNISNITDTPPSTTLNQMALSPRDVNEAYVVGRSTAVPGHGAGAGSAGEGGNIPLIWRTKDGGKSWTRIVSGLPKNQPTGSWVNVVRADPEQAGLLFCGTETTVYVSFDDGDHWQSLRQNLPSTSIRDMVFHTHDHMNDLVLGTYGRGFWIMDDMSPLRQVAAESQAIASAPAYLFKPGDAIRSRENVNWDQPTEPEENHEVNPPFGALIYYHLSQAPTGPIYLRIYDSAGNLVRTISSQLPPKTEGAEYPDYWLATPESRTLSTSIGTNRINWNLLYDDPPAFNHDLENQMNMVEGEVTAGPHGPLAIPGQYTVKLDVDGKTYSQPLTVINDPRVGDSPAIMSALRAQNKLTLMAYDAMKTSFAGNDEVAAVRAQLDTLMKGQLPDDVATQAKALDTKLAEFGGAPAGRGGRGGFGGGGGRGGRGGANPNAVQSFMQLNNSFNVMVSMMQVSLDTISPTAAQVATWNEDCANFGKTAAAWKAEASGISDFNAVLSKANLQPLTLPSGSVAAPNCSFKP